MKTEVEFGFNYVAEVIAPDGTVTDRQTFHNRVPTEGLHYIGGAALLGATPITAFYVAPYENDYTPIAADVAATFPGAGVANEITTYDEATRVVWTPGTFAAGVVSNTASKAEFTFNAEKTVRGLMMSSIATKGATSGVLVSAAKLPAAQLVPLGSTLSVTATFTFTSS